MILVPRERLCHLLCSAALALCFTPVAFAATDRDPRLESQIAAIRGFSRFYTRKLGIIEPKLLDSPWPLQEARIIYEIGMDRNGKIAASSIRFVPPEPAA